MNRLNRGLCFALGWIIFAASSVAYPQGYPNKPIRIVSPFSAGGNTDIIARIIAQKLTENLGQPVILDARPGANGIIGADTVAKAAPDGYTIVLASNGTHGVNVSLFNKLPYDPIKDFAPITQMGRVTLLLVTGNNLPANSIKEFVALAKADPGKRTLAYAHSTGQLSGELFKLAAAIDMTMVPYKVNSAAFIDLASGRLDAQIELMTSSLPQIKAGRIKALAATSAKRSSLLPEVPTIAESGYPGFETTAWWGFYAPAGTPAEIIAKLHTEIVRVLLLPEVKEKLLQNGVEVIANSPDDLSEATKTEIAKWARLFKEAHLPRIN